MTIPTPESQPPSPILVDVYAVAEMLSMSVAMVHKLTRTGQLPSVKVGRLRRYRVSDLERIAMDGIA